MDRAVRRPGVPMTAPVIPQLEAAAEGSRELGEQVAVADYAKPWERYEFRPSQWGDVETGEPLFSIEARRPGGAWMHVALKGKAALYATAAERDEAIAALRARGIA